MALRLRYLIRALALLAASQIPFALERIDSGISLLFSMLVVVLAVPEVLAAVWPPELRESIRRIAPDRISPTVDHRSSTSSR